jgi:hypothetical protein
MVWLYNLIDSHTIHNTKSESDFLVNNYFQKVILVLTRLQQLGMFIGEKIVILDPKESKLRCAKLTKLNSLVDLFLSFD